MNRRNFFKSALGLAAFAATGISIKPAASKPIRKFDMATGKDKTVVAKAVTGTGKLEMIVDGEWTMIARTESIEAPQPVDSGERVYRTNERQKLLLNHDPADSIGHLEGGYLVPNEFGAELIKRLKK